MYVKSITLSNYRNYSGQNLMLKNGLNIVFGENASGKTNLLESIYLCGLGKSARATKDKELIRWGAKMAYVRVEIVKKFRTYLLEMRVDDKNKKYILLDGIPLKRIGDLMGVLNIVYFSPDEMRLIKESPAERRRFMDISLSQQKKLYFDALVKYNKILAQRNKLLKGAREYDTLEDMLPVWDEQLAREGATVIKARYEFVEEISKIAREIHSDITARREKLEIKYESSVKNGTRQEMEARLLAMLKESGEKDFNLGFTTVGAHRDDIEISSNEVDLRKFGSQGQQRTAALSLKLAEIVRFERETGEKPVLLLDDVLSELDEARRRQLLIATKGVQTILTCTEAGQAKSTGLVKEFIRVTNGKAEVVAFE